MFTKILRWLVLAISKIHDYLLTLNDSYEMYLNDKQLHFLIIGLLGLGMLLVVYPLFTWLAKRDKILTISGLYVFTVIVVIAFAIEIGQGLSGTGAMEMRDAAAGILGFVAFFIAFFILRFIVRLIKKASESEY